MSLLLTCIVSTTSKAQEIKPDEQWRYCTVDQDCIHIEYACAQSAVNRKFANVAEAYLSQENAKSNCISRRQDKDKPEEPYRVYCEAKQCKVRGHNPKPPKFS